ncbi:MAG: DUF58 domain-containing protein [Acidimicrobiales bacterium]
MALMAWAAVAHNSGVGWVQTLGALLAGILLVGLVMPGLVVWKVRCTVTDAPRDTVAGTPAALTLRVSAPVAVRLLFPSGPEVITGRHASCRIPFTAPRRGVFDAAVLQVASAAPFGMLWWSKRIVLPMPHPVAVAPAPGTAAKSHPGAEGPHGDGHLRTDQRVGDSRGVRPYQPGDHRHWVHWPATAHTGTMMVREMEGPALRPVTVRAILPADLDTADEIAAQALGSVARHLARGQPVILVTLEPDREVVAEVKGVTDAGRRLARALPSRPPPSTPRPPTGRERPPVPAVPSPSGAAPVALSPRSVRARLRRRRSS